MKKNYMHVFASLALASAASAQIINSNVVYKDDFDDSTVGDDATTLAGWQGGQRFLYTVANDGSSFSGTNYLNMESRATNWSFVNHDAVADAIATLSFDIIVPSTEDQTGYFRVALRGDGNTINLANLDIGPADAGRTYVVTADTKTHFDFVVNTSDSTINYDGFSLDADSYAVYIDGVETTNTTSSNLAALVDRFGMWMHDSASDTAVAFNIDKMVVQSTAYVQKDAELSQLDAGFEFGQTLHVSPTDETLFTVTYEHTGSLENLTIDSISINNDGGGVFTIDSAPANGTVIAPCETFDVTVKATGGSGVTMGEITINTTHAGTAPDQDRVDPINVEVLTVPPPANFSYTAAGGFPKVLPGGSKPSFTVTATGGVTGTSTLEITSAVEPALLSIVSPELPITINSGDSVVFEVEVDAAATPGTLTDTITLNTTDPTLADQPVDVAFNVFSSGTVVLVDYDDGIANGIHDVAVRNGGFEQGVDGDNFDVTPDWASKTGNNTQPQSTEQLTFAADPATGALRGRTGSWRAPGALFIPVHDLLPENWTLEEGDYFTVEYKWKASDGFDTNVMKSNCVMFGQNADGTVVGDLAFRPIQVESTTTQTTTYNTVSFDSTPLTAGHPTLGLGFRFLLECSDSNDLEAPTAVYTLIDDVTVIGHFSTGTETPQSRITSVVFNPATKDVTLKWLDEGGAYSIEANNDLNWAAPTMIPLDGSETVTDGEYEFMFNDPGATGSERFWRVAD